MLLLSLSTVLIWPWKAKKWMKAMKLILGGNKSHTLNQYGWWIRCNQTNLILCWKFWHMQSFIDEVTCCVHCCIVIRYNNWYVFQMYSIQFHGLNNLIDIKQLQFTFNHTQLSVSWYWILLYTPLCPIAELSLVSYPAVIALYPNRRCLTCCI